jgi:Protein of unknown function (DUF1566)
MVLVISFGMMGVGLAQNEAVPVDRQVQCQADKLKMQVGLAGHTDWRLPTIIELKTLLLVPFPCFTVPCVDPVFNNGTDSFTAVGAYWSSTTLDSSPVFAWLVSFGNGVVADNDKIVAGSARAARGGQ